MTEGISNLAQQIQEQVLKSAQDFYGNSLGSLKSQVENDRSQLQELLEQLPGSQEDARAQLEELVASYEAIGDSLDEVAQQQGVEEAVDQAAQQAQQTVGQATEQVREEAGQAIEQAQESAGQLAQETQDAAGQTAEEAQGAAKRADKIDATGAARQRAEQLGVDFSEVQGTGAGGRITLRDVTEAAQGG